MEIACVRASESSPEDESESSESTSDLSESTLPYQAVVAVLQYLHALFTVARLPPEECMTSAVTSAMTSESSPDDPSLSTRLRS